MHGLNVNSDVRLLLQFALIEGFLAFAPIVFTSPPVALPGSLELACNKGLPRKLTTFRHHGQVNFLG